ncbi:terpenoid cyclases/protein prenyltransferase alpha-alpha toroid [Lipomyces japonicus]|uniref:terpenoid cyclases/protein prenyltransferase alpha-alpha toroid n=1 Tax=Lipomyces japonicus TaxID=56871 RepID=UPI0034CF9195
MPFPPSPFLNNSLPDHNHVHNSPSPLADTFVTETLESQQKTVEECDSVIVNGYLPLLKRQQHRDYITVPFETSLPEHFVTLDASHPWLFYWPLTSLSIQSPDALTADIKSRVWPSVAACWNDTDGGFGGGFGQTAHLAPTYASLNSLAISDDQTAWSRIDRVKVYDFILSLKRADGSFVMHDGGESDTRAAYTAVASGALLDLLTPELVGGVAEWVGRCQTYEGGLGGAPGNEAHGGYTFCGIAALCIVGDPKVTIKTHIDVDRLIRWMTARQYQPEGGFSGRTNKLVDGCYSGWIGATWAILDGVLGLSSSSLWSKPDLQKFALSCCQGAKGGMRDKPGKNPDQYHTCYNSVGLSVIQHRYAFLPSLRENRLNEWSFMWEYAPEEDHVVSVRVQDAVEPINPVHMLPWGAGEKMHDFFASQVNLSSLRIHEL